MRTLKWPHDMSLPLAIQMFGPLRVFVHGEPMPRVRTRSVEWLLALLALTDRPISRSWLAGTLWPDSTESQALLNLRTDLVRLRKSLGTEGVRIVSGQNFDLWLDGTDAQIDVRDFDSAIRAGDATSIERAADLYGGSLLVDCDREWIIAERQRRERECVEALQTLADAALTAGDVKRALDLCRRSEALDPYSDRTQRAIMRTLQRLGDAPAALLSFRDYRLRLRGDLAMEPDAETAALFQEIRRHARESVRVTVPSGAPSRSAPGRNAVEPFHSLPAPPHPLTTLIGREEDVQAVEEALVAHRLVTLVGGGGVGKTRLAIETLHRRAVRREGQVAYVELAGLTDGDLLPSHLAVELGYSDALRTDDQPARSLARAIGATELLLTLDNCEHLIEAAAALTQMLLERCPNLRIFATSRQALGLTGEVAWRVPSLPCPDFAQIDSLASGEAAASDRLLLFPAVQLFVERARAARPDVALTTRPEVLAVARICRRLDGIPLAIELAAARVRSLSVQEIQARLEDRFRLMVGGSRAVLPRHQTLLATIEWSWNLLNDDERGLLRMLSVFAGGWNIEAAATLWRSEQTVTFARLDSAHDDIRAALSFCRHDPESAEHGLRIAGALWWYWWMRGQLNEGRERLAAALSRDGVEAYPSSQAMALHGVGILALHQGDHEAALEFHREALAIREELADRVGIAASIRSQANVLLAQGRYLEAEELYTHALKINREIDDRLGQESSLAGLGNVALSQHRHQEARACFEEALKLCREAGDYAHQSIYLASLGEIAFLEGDYKLAETLKHAALKVCRDIGHREWEAGNLASLGRISCRQGQLDQGLSLCQEGLAIQYQLGVKKDAYFSIAAIASVKFEQGFYADAARLFSSCRVIGMTLGAPLLDEGEAARMIGRCQAELGASFDSYWAQGTTMTIDATVDYALSPSSM